MLAWKRGEHPRGPQLLGLGICYRLDSDLQSANLETTPIPLDSLTSASAVGQSVNKRMDAQHADDWFQYVCKICAKVRSPTPYTKETNVGSVF